MSIIRFLIVSLILAFLAAVGLFGWAHSPVKLDEPEVEVVIKPGSGVFSIAHQLEQSGVKVSSKLFGLWAKLLEWRLSQPKAGTYKLGTGITPHQILLKMIRGDIVRVKVIIVEGWDFQKMRETIDAQAKLRHDSINMTSAQLLAAINASEYLHPEGLFFPDTYLVSAGSSDLEIFKQAYQAGQKHLNEIWATRAPGLPYQGPYEALIMASIIEKETGQAKDRNMISAVFLNRLKLGMRLQTDPTVIYGMGRLFDGNLRKKDLLTDTPYNSYTRLGLPPTPISLPSRESLIAAVHPAHADALFFVARGDGSSAFSSNLADHSRAVNQFQRFQQARPKKTDKKR